MKSISIASKTVGSDQPCFVIAEAGINHNGDMQLAKRLIDAAKAAGADAVKFQTFEADKLVTAHSPKADYQKANTGKGETQHDMLARVQLTEADHVELIEYCRKASIIFLSSPFHEEAAALLARLKVPALKIPSGEITNLPYLATLARFGIPLIVSTGMSTLAEVGKAIETIKQSGDPPVVLLHCLSNYPADPAETNLRAMVSLGSAFDVPVGYSDHTEGTDVAVAAVALGACIIEKHLTLDRTLPGPDHLASLEPQEFGRMVKSIRIVERALGDGIKRPQPSEMNTRAIARKSVVAARDLAAGNVLRREDLAVRRPGTGLAPDLIPTLVGRTLRVAIPAGTILGLEMLA